MTPPLPAVGLVVLGLGLVGAGLAAPVATSTSTATGPIAQLVAPASRGFARSATIGIGTLEALGGVVLATLGWSR